MESLHTVRAEADRGPPERWWKREDAGWHVRLFGVRNAPSPRGGAPTEPRVRGVCASFPHINTLDNPWDNLPGTRRTVTPRGLRLIDHIVFVACSLNFFN